MRLTKKIGNTNYTYLYENGLLVQETRGNEIFDYSYDANGSIRMLKHRATESATPTYYYYALNSRSDVVGLYNSSGAVCAKYTYDPWGNITSVTNASGTTISDENNIAHTQPFRYRSYYYDTDSKFYYLQSRYYDPVTHRFINADGLVSTGTGVLGHNMFAYCDNNPINCSDPSGMLWKEIGKFFSNAWNAIKTWTKNTFGAGSSTTATLRGKEEYIIPSPSPITFTVGEATTQTVTSSGNSTKPISVYANGNLDNYITSSVGLNIHVDDFKFNINLAVDNFGCSFSVINNCVEDTFAITADATRFQLGIETSTAISWDNTTETVYTNVSGSAWYIAAILGFSIPKMPKSFAPKAVPSY